MGEKKWLNQLKDYLHDYPFQPFYSTLLHENKPLEKTIIIHNGNIIDAADFTIVMNKITAGGLQVLLDGEPLGGASVLMAGSCFSGENIQIGKGTLIETGAMIKAPTIIGDCNEVRQGAYIRGDVISGKGCVVGHATEVKHSIFLNDAKAGHFNYIGDAILGNNTNLGAGTKIANLRFIKGNLFIRFDGKYIDTGRRKFGAILGDETQTGCNSVTNPGAIIGKGSFIMPNATVTGGYHPPGSTIRAR